MPPKKISDLKAVRAALQDFKKEHKGAQATQKQIINFFKKEYPKLLELLLQLLKQRKRKKRTKKSKAPAPAPAPVLASTITTLDRQLAAARNLTERQGILDGVRAQEAEKKNVKTPPALPPPPERKLLMPPPPVKALPPPSPKEKKDASGKEEKHKVVQLTKDVSVRVHPADASLVKKGHKMMVKELKDADKALFKKKHLEQSNAYLDAVNNELEAKLAKGDGKAKTWSEGIRYWARKMKIDTAKYNTQEKQLKKLKSGEFHEINDLEHKIEHDLLDKYPLVKQHGLKPVDETPLKEDKSNVKKWTPATPKKLDFETDVPLVEDSLMEGDGFLGMGVSKSLTDYIAKNGMTNTQIEEVMKNVPGWQGCYARDEGLPIRDKEAKQKFWIKNTDNRGQGGEHWFAICITPDTSEYYDSFGRPCPNDILAQIIKVGSPKGSFLENTVAMQNANSSTCGVFSMMFCVRRLTMSFAAATGFKQLKNSVKGEKEAKAFMDSFKPFQTLEVHGKGVVEWLTRVRDFFKGKRKGAPPAVRKIMEENGGRKITNMVVTRQPVQSYVQKFLNLISLGGLDRAKKELNYDDVFHLSLWVRLDNNQWIKMEKNQVLNFTRGSGPSGQQMAVSLAGKSIDLLTFYKNAESKMGMESFYQYSASKNNCQHFIQGLLRGSGLLTAELNKFIMQDVKSIMEKLPGFVPKLADTVTDAAAQVDVLANGSGQRGGHFLDEVLDWLGLRKKKTYEVSPETQAKVNKSIAENNKYLNG